MKPYWPIKAEKKMIAHNDPLDWAKEAEIDLIIGQRLIQPKTKAVPHWLYDKHHPFDRVIDLAREG